MSHLLNIKFLAKFFADNGFWSKTAKFRRRLPHSLKNSESGIVLLCLLTVRSSSISNIPHPWKSCRNHFYRSQIHSWDRYSFFCFSPTAKIRVPDIGSLSYHILSSQFLFSQFHIVLPTVWIPMPQILSQKKSRLKTQSNNFGSLYYVLECRKFFIHGREPR